MSEWMDRWNIFLKNAEACYVHQKPEDLIHNSHISLRHKYLYVETPKVACSTIKRLLIDAEFGGEVDMQHSEYIHFREFSPLLNARQTGNFKAFLNREDIFKFCFVRNPYSRLLSCYLDKILNRKGQHYWPQIQTGYGPFYEEALSFKEFIQAICQQPIMHMDFHWRTQYYMTFQSCIHYDFIGRFENFETDLRIVLNKLSIDFDQYYQTVNPHKTKTQELMDSYYTKEIRTMVNDKFKIDFETFGYQMKNE